MKTVFSLGRYGDLVSNLPIAYDLAQSGEKPQWFVSREHASIFDGVSYVTPVIWDGSYNQAPSALKELRRRNYGLIINAQIYQHEDQNRSTDSYQKESWRVAGYLEKFGTLPLVFDRRSSEREASLVQAVTKGQPFILVAPSGISSPFESGDALVRLLRERVTGHVIIDLRTVKAERVYDLLGLMDRSALVVSVDSVLLHLARACTTPVIAIINNGWGGSVPPPSAKAVFRYREANNNLFGVTDAIIKLLGQPSVDRRVFHVADLFGDTERHQRARASWPALYENLGVLPVHFSSMATERSANKIGDPRVLPLFKDVIAPAMAQASESDVIIWTNDDVGLDPKIVDWAKEHVGRVGAASMRRKESTGASHMGRDLFAFTLTWLHRYWDEIPDFYCGAPGFDLVMAAMIRRHHGVGTTLKNLDEDFPPADAKERYVFHEAHLSSWAGVNETIYPANSHNLALARAWCQKHCQTLSL